MKWEYKTIRLETPVSEYSKEKVEEILEGLAPELNQAGQEEWELVSLLPIEALGYTNFVVAVFKRLSQ